MGEVEVVRCCPNVRGVDSLESGDELSTARVPSIMSHFKLMLKYASLEETGCRRDRRRPCPVGPLVRSPLFPGALFYCLYSTVIEAVQYSN